jgi:transposase-like protein
MRTPRDPIYAGHRYPAEIISYAVWLCFRFPLSLRMVEEMLAARGSAHDQVANVFPRRRDHGTAANLRSVRTQAFTTWADVTGVAMAA